MTQYSRRNFIKISSASAAGLMVLPYCSSPTPKIDIQVGVQLYTLRDAIASDIEGSFEKLSQIGYKNVELAHYSDGKFYGKTPKEFKKLLSDKGLKAVSSHTSVEAEGIQLDQAKIMAEAHAEIGVKYCVQPWVEEKDRNVERYKQLVGEWNKVGEVMKNNGIQFGYHNHNFEFANFDGIIPYYDILLKEMDSELIVMELDLFWATKAGQDPVKIFEKYPGRIHLLHLKDMKLDNAPYFTIQKDDITSVGSGLIDFKRILSYASLGGVKYGFVEDDNQGGGQPFEAVKTSFNNLNNTILS